MGFAEHLQTGLDGTDWQALDLWIASIGIGADFELGTLQGFLAGAQAPTPGEYAVLAAALNEQLGQLGKDHSVRPWHEVNSTP